LKDRTTRILNYEINLTFRRQVAVAIKTATTIEPYIAATTKARPAKYETLTTATQNSFKIQAFSALT